MSTPSMPKIPSRASIKAKVRRYSVEAHRRGSHETRFKPDCPLCDEERRLTR